MKIFVLAATAIATLSAVNAAEQSSIHLRIHEKGGPCTITNESQCNGQNWTGSTCCADSSYECRWSDDGQNVQRCQKKWGKHHHKAAEEDTDEDSVDDIGLDDIAESLGLDPEDYDSFSDFDDLSDYFGDDSSADDDEGSSEDSSDEDNEKHHHKKDLQKGGSCTITNESQCNGQNWTGSTCCADSNYECRWSDDGQNVKRCQKKKW